MTNNEKRKSCPECGQTFVARTTRVKHHSVKCKYLQFLRKGGQNDGGRL